MVTGYKRKEITSCDEMGIVTGYKRKEINIGIIVSMESTLEVVSIENTTCMLLDGYVTETCPCIQQQKFLSGINFLPLYASYVFHQLHYCHLYSWTTHIVVQFIF